MVPETTTNGERDGEQTTLNVEDSARKFDRLAGVWVTEMHPGCVRVEVSFNRVWAEFDTDVHDGKVEAPEGFDIKSVRVTKTNGILCVKFREVDR